MRFHKAFGLACLLSAFSVAALAASPPPGSFRQACGHDIMTLCKGVKKGDGAIKACMRDNYRKLSPDCKAAIKVRREQKAAAAAPPPSP